MNADDRPTHLDLFSGIGGFALAAQWAGFRTVGFCEIDPYAQRVLAKNFGAKARQGAGDRGAERLARTKGTEQRGVPQIIGDIGELNGRDFAGVDLITAGIPCQAHSHMGRRDPNDKRRLWPECRRVISLSLPRFVLIENVLGYLSSGLGETLQDLSEIGYSAEWGCLSSAAVGSAQDRTRLWIVAYPDWWIKQKPHEWTFLPSEVPSSPAWRGQPVPFGNRGVNGLSDRLDVTRRISALANAIVPQAALLILKAIREQITSGTNNGCSVNAA